VARSPINFNPLALSALQSLDTTNGNTLVGLGRNDIGVLLDKWYPANFHMVYVTSGSGNIVIKAGYMPEAPSMSAGDLTIAVSGTNTVTDIGPQIDLRRHLKQASGDRYIDIDYTGGITGNVLVCFGYAQTIPGNTALNVDLKKSPGLLVGAVVTTLGTAGLSIYDNPATAQGTALLAIAPSAAQGSLFALGVPFRNGLLAAGVANNPAITAFYA
jgi:hypothetical protein